jgi:hypothetical protein
MANGAGGTVVFLSAAMSSIDQITDLSEEHTTFASPATDPVNTRYATWDSPLSERFCHSRKGYAKEVACVFELSSTCFRR